MPCSVVLRLSLSPSHTLTTFTPHTYVCVNTYLNVEVLLHRVNEWLDASPYYPYSFTTFEFVPVCVRILFNMNEAFDKLIWSFCFVSTQNFLVNGVTILVANQRPQIFKNILLRFGDGNLISQGLDELWTVYFVFFKCDFFINFSKDIRSCKREFCEETLSKKLWFV